METAAEHAGGDPEKDYCLHCARPDGSMQSYDEKLESMARFIIQTEGLEEQAARDKAAKWLAKQPAWQNRAT